MPGPHDVIRSKNRADRSGWRMPAGPSAGESAPFYFHGFRELSLNRHGVAAGCDGSLGEKTIPLYKLNPDSYSYRE